jgi:hypothetical protein
MECVWTNETALNRGLTVLKPIVLVLNTKVPTFSAELVMTHESVYIQTIDPLQDQPTNDQFRVTSLFTRNLS